ncbi:MAG: aldehyde ferredoxin oxidoreductase family protein [Candidatus Thorarchaeota archaeon]
MGYMGKYLDIDLSKDEIKEFPLNLSLAEKYIGGKGLGARLLYDNLNAGVDPLGSDNVILFMTGPLSGTTMQTSGRWCIVTKSPQTGIFNDSHIGGRFGYQLKRAGFDFLIIRGRAPRFSYIRISDESVDIQPADDLLGLGTFETEDKLRHRHRGSEVASIVPAGENLVTYASIVTGKTHVARRGGTGAVLGCKDLKAVVAHGKNSIDAADPMRFELLTKDFSKKVLDDVSAQQYHEIGTVVWVNMSNLGGFLPTRNYQSGFFESAEAISGEYMSEEFVVGHSACYMCRIACGKKTRFKDGKYAGLEVDGPEYETVALLGSNCGISDMGAIAKSSQICDDLGIDTISAGATISFAMEANDKGILKQDDVDGLTFGNDDAVHRLLHLISEKQGVGELLSKGSIAAARQLGHDSSHFAIQVKRLELAAVEPRGSWGMALAYSTADRGACHQRCWTPTAELTGEIPRFSMKGVPKYVKETQDERAVCGSLVVCDFLPFEIHEMTDLLNASTGFSFSVDSYMNTGERIWNLTRMFNVREGINAKDDVLPERFSDESMPDGPAEGQRITKRTLEKAKTEYYALRGWDDNGVPTEEILRSLGLY